MERLEVQYALNYIVHILYQIHRKGVKTPALRMFPGIRYKTDQYKDIGLINLVSVL